MEDEGQDRHAEMRFSQDLPPDSPARRFSYEPRGRASLRSEPRNRETNATGT